MKQKLSEKQSQNDGATVLSGKERLQLLKSLKNGNGNSSSSQKTSSSSSSSSTGLSSSATRPLPTSASSSSAGLPADFFDSGFSVSSSTIQPSVAKSTDSEKRDLSMSIATPSAGSNGFPAGFFDNPYEEKHALQSVGQSSSSSVSARSAQQKDQNNLNQDPDLASFMEDIHTISSLPRSLSIEQEIAVFDALETGASREDLLKLDEIEGEAINEERISEQEDQEPLPLLPMENEETYEKLVQSAHLAKLGLFYSKLEQMSNNKQTKGKSTKKSGGSASSALLQEQNEIEKEIKELEFMISNSNEVDDTEVKPSDPSNMVEALYLKKLKAGGKRKHDEVEEEIEKEKKVLHNDKRLKHRKVEKEDDDNDEESDDEESEDDDEEEEDEESENERNGYNPLEFF
jgi:hypothetical protein